MKYIHATIATNTALPCLRMRNGIVKPIATENAMALLMTDVDPVHLQIPPCSRRNLTDSAAFHVLTLLDLFVRNGFVLTDK